MGNDPQSSESQMQQLQDQLQELELQLAAARQERDSAQALAGELQAILMALPEPVLIYGPDGTVVQANASALRTYGFDPTSRYYLENIQALAARSPDGEPIAPEQRPAARALKGQTVIAEQMEITNPQGQKFEVLASAGPLVVNGVQRGAVVIWQDITAQHLAELELRENERMLRLALKAGRAGAWVWDVAANKLQWSDEYYRVFGFEPGSIEPSAEAGFSRIHPEDRPKVEAAVRRALELGTPIDEAHRVIWPDGSLHWVRGISQLFPSGKGKPVRMAGIAMDITDQKQAEIELQAAHRQVVDILESIQDAFYSLDQEGRFTYINRKAANLWNRSPAELLGRNIWEAFPSGRDTESYVKIQQALADRQPTRYETYSQYMDQWIEVHIYPAEQGISVYFQDITPRKRAEAALAEFNRRLERSNQDLEQFAYIASHDLQEPLRKIEGFSSELLHSETQIDPRQRDYLERIRNASIRMRDLVNGLLQLSRINTQAKPFTRVALSDTVAAVLTDLEAQIKRTGGQVEVGWLPQVVGDPVLLHRLFLNLISNALKYHRPDTPPVVKVSARQLETAAQILVEDNGIGFPASAAEQVFLPFKRLVSRSEFEGSGMGLAICRRIVERHGGEITATGMPGQGAVFCFTLPTQDRAMAGSDTPGVE